MCMEFLNVTSTCYKNVSTMNNNIISLSYPFDSIKTNVKNDIVFIDDFFIVTHISLMGTNNEEKKEKSLLEKMENLDVKIRLTKCDSDKKKQLGIDLDTFTVDLNKNRKNIRKACFSYFNYKRITPINEMELFPGIGTYVIKVFVKESTQPEDKYTIQTMSYFHVELE